MRKQTKQAILLLSLLMVLIALVVYGQQTSTPSTSAIPYSSYATSNPPTSGPYSGYPLAPNVPTSPTIGAGADLTAFCNSLSGDAKNACFHGTTLGGQIQNPPARGGANGCKWDIGAYQWPCNTPPVAPNPPTGLGVTIK